MLGRASVVYYATVPLLEIRDCLSQVVKYKLNSTLTYQLNKKKQRQTINDYYIYGQRNDLCGQFSIYASVPKQQRNFLPQ